MFKTGDFVVVPHVGILAEVIDVNREALVQVRYMGPPEMGYTGSWYWLHEVALVSSLSDLEKLVYNIIASNRTY